ncbi:DUF1194 domain-containing protein [Marimonas arenosa]|uniref:DUF1194 domain-containing protein n=1 Tax=Marimonas arenosa TaxID=1795305 RepID=A0AAE3WB43_9RHOB|nr:DUF1194 domain-containing protein [Marimonas arenosa]MDQ2088363.1 DUF1194 domain-containing protein [Marimonas arenosa]
MRTLLFFLILFTLPARAAEEVDLELFLAVDVSQSMSFEELEIQRQGYAAALLSPSVMDAIRGGMLGVVAITYVEWAGTGSHKVVVPWTRVASLKDMTEVAEAITANFENPRRRTSISSILLYGERAINSNAFTGLRRVIDVSGDGPNNMGPPVTAARDRAVGLGLTINGLPLMTRDTASDIWGIPDLDIYYAECVVGGPGAFVLPVRSWEEFAPALRRKLVQEIAGHTPPGRTRMIPAQAYDCLIGEKIWQRNMQRGFLDP